MPIYEYQCHHCGHVWDELRKLSDGNPDACPSCGHAELGQRMTAAGFRLKGSGWYETDFKQDQKRNLADSPSTDSNTSSEKSEAKPASESKAEAPSSTSSQTNQASSTTNKTDGVS